MSGPCNHDRCLTPYCPHCGTQLASEHYLYRTLMAHLEKIAKGARTRVENETRNCLRQGHAPNKGYVDTWTEKAEQYEDWARMVQHLKETHRE